MLNKDGKKSEFHTTPQSIASKREFSLSFFMLFANRKWQSSTESEKEAREHHINPSESRQVRVEDMVRRRYLSVIHPPGQDPIHNSSTKDHCDDSISSESVDRKSAIVHYSDVLIMDLQSYSKNEKISGFSYHFPPRSKGFWR